MKKKSIKKLIAILACSMMFTTVAAAEERGIPIAGYENGDTYTQDAYEAANKGIEVSFIYQPQQLYQIYLQEGYITDIVLEKGEKINYIGGGDTTRWIIDTSSSGNSINKISHIFIKPIQRGISTNLIINTDRRTYQLTLISGSFYNPIVSWRFPKSDQEIYQDKKITEYSNINPNNINFRYSISNKKYKWSPAMVFDSGKKTYIKMKPDIINSELPAFFVLDDDNKMTLVSYRYVKGYIIVDRLFDKAVLLLGKKKVNIKRDK